MENFKIFSLENIKNKMLSFLLATTLMLSIIYVFLSSYFNIYLITSVIIIAIVFLLCDFVSKHRILGAIVYFVSTILLFYIMYMIIVNQASDTISTMIEFVEWFFSGGQAVDTKVYNMQIIVIGFSFFFGSVVYYFTITSYRTVMIMIICLIPCALYVKVSVMFSAWLAIFVAALNIFIYLKNCRKEISNNAKVIGGHSVLGNYADFAIAAVLLAFILPKPSVTPYYEKFEEFANKFTIGGIYSKNSGKYMKTSGNANDFLEMENILLYIVTTNFPEYFKVQVFENYDIDNHNWETNNNVEGNARWEKERGKLNYSKLLEAYKSAVALNPEIEEKYDLTNLLNLEIKDTERTANVRTINYISEYIISTIRTNNVTFPDGIWVLKTYRSQNGEIFPDIDKLSSNETYTVSYYDNNFINNSGWIDAGGCNFTLEEYGYLIYDVATVLNENDDPNKDIIAAFEHEYIEVMNYYRNFDYAISDEIKALSDEITAGLTFDWEKAAAIERYFHDGSFRYDLAYRPPRNSNTAEFFLFESKRGTCSDFATAYCLLAKSAGLTIRYTEGFVPNALSGMNGVYEINTENAHAYPEVFISGAGWKVYEPTVADLSGVSSANAEARNNAATLENIVTVIVVAVLVVLVIVIILLMPKFIENLFRVRVKFMKNKKAVLVLYNRHCKQINRLFAIDTSSMTATQIHKLTALLTEHDDDAFTNAFTKACYSDVDITNDEKTASFNAYKNQYKLLKKRKKADKKKAVHVDYALIISENK